MNVKTFLTTAITTVTLAVTSFANAGYDVYHINATGHHIFVDYESDYVEDPNKDNFDVVYDAESNKVVFTTSETFQGTTVVTRNYQCEIPSDNALFAEAVELAENIALVESFNVRFSVIFENPTCQNLNDIEYRSDIAKVDFFCDYGYTYWGQSVYVVGNTEALGNWNPANAVKLDADDYPTWSKSLVVEADENIEWKCIKRNEDDPTQGIEWENGSNNTLNSIQDSQTSGAF